MLGAGAEDRLVVNEAFLMACHLGKATAAAVLLDRAIAIDGDLGRRIDGGPGRSGFIQHFMENRAGADGPDGDEPWQMFAKQQIVGAMQRGDLQALSKDCVAKEVCCRTRA